MKKEKIFTIIVFIVVLFIPLIYSFFYLKSYWNPYGNLSDMKIAVVNMDKGSDNENQGEEFVKSLQDSNTFDIYISCDTNLRYVVIDSFVTIVVMNSRNSPHNMLEFFLIF